MKYLLQYNLNIYKCGIFLFCIPVFVLLLYYNGQIRKIEVEENIINKITSEEKFFDDQENIDVEPNEYAQPEETIAYENNENTEKYLVLFNEVKYIVEEQGYFKAVNFTISQLSNILKVNNLYISKSIKAKGYINFNHYLNICRIENVKRLIDEDDFNKVTLMYIYTASGFANQSTFNRVFKQIEGITPSEYVKIKSKKI